MSLACRELAPLSAPDISLLELTLDAQAAQRDPRQAAQLSIVLAQRLVAAYRLMERRLDQAKRHENTAWAMLEADLTDHPNGHHPGDFGNDPAADWPTDHPEAP
jgi:hypothetical protein